MPVPLISKHVTKSTIDDPHYQRELRKEHAIDLALRAFHNDGAVEVAGTRSSNGIGQLLAGAYPEHSAAPAKAKKADHGPLHSRTKAVADGLPENAARLLDLIIRADEANHRAQLIEADVFAIANALDISTAEAEAARRGLENAGYIRFFDSHSGDRGYRPTV